MISSPWDLATTRRPGIEQFLTGTPQITGTAAVDEGARLLGEAGIGALREPKASR